ncbi:hypothetical protein JIN85_18865 [Luteolibacter pohnpeiensis]|uniref:Uncharacterized protein n=1 Tax=Luteolibacter pohnpeiensis TaxID=454153 RepID=A0A934S7G6_9BACT|nr:hypothetical protein [Luteolibacter pohnpeiensis]MBK1884485.1 hypothetical protein [Luteolibacter pohnpeiensis]
MSKSSSSSSGVGILGLLLAAIVVIGFGGLFVMVFADDFPALTSQFGVGGKDGKSEIDQLNEQLASNKDKLARSAEITASADALIEQNRANAERRDSIQQLQDQVSELKSVLASKDEEFEKYKNSYRSYIRGAAVGEKMPVLVTVSGETFKNVEIREVNSVGMQIRHATGIKRIPYEDLPDKLRDRFQFDEEQKQELLKKERELQLRHEAAVAAAKEAREQAQSQQAEAAPNAGQILSPDDQKQALEVSRLRRQAEQLSREIKEIDTKIRDELGKAEVAHIHGTTHSTANNDKLKTMKELKLRQLEKVRDMIKEAERNM